MSDQWGSVDGDTNAVAIVTDRKRDLTSLTATLSVFVLGLIASGVWYGMTGSHSALASEIGLAAICAAGWARKDLYATHTFVMIAERRIQLVEQKIQDIQEAQADAVIHRQAAARARNWET